MNTVSINNNVKLKRDISSKAILQTDSIALERYKKSHELTDTVYKLKRDVDEIKSTLEEIKNLLIKVQ